jgi:hypothetical protein
VKSPLFRKRREKEAAENFKAAQDALQEFWGTRGLEGLAEATEACRKLDEEQLRLVEIWLPYGSSGSVTTDRCSTARRVVARLIEEKAR